MVNYFRILIEASENLLYDSVYNFEPVFSLQDCWTNVLLFESFPQKTHGLESYKKSGFRHYLMYPHGVWILQIIHPRFI